jgi:hypothetical protein
MGSNPTGGLDVCLLCVLPGRGLCDELITCPEQSYRLWRVVVCGHENLVDEKVITRAGREGHNPRWAAGPERKKVEWIYKSVKHNTN